MSTDTFKITAVKDGVITIENIPSISYFELVKIEKGDSSFYAIVLDVLEDSIKAVLLDGITRVEAGDTVIPTGKQPTINVSENILGKVIDIFGKRLDKEELPSSEGKDMPIEKVAPGVIERLDVYRPLQTGILAIDALIPIGKGQRQLILGDRQTGKTSIAIDTIINLKESKTICIYIAIGQKKSKVAQIVRKLKEEDAFANTVVINASASDPASQQYLAPYVGTAIAEYFAEAGKDALVVYDDLSKHANAYRQISLLLERPSGREAYPGDIFYLHSKLLERSVQYSKELGNGSITALPIIETLAGDLSAYIPTNVISITDGQIFTDKDLFNAGQRPAISVGSSVSRVGGAAQTKAVKSVAGKLKLDLAQFRELAAFAQFGSDLDEFTKTKLKRGKVATEILKQNIYSPYSVAAMVVILEAVNSGKLDNVSISLIKLFTDRVSSRVNQLTKFDANKKVEEEIKIEIHDLIEDILSTLNV